MEQIVFTIALIGMGGILIAAAVVRRLRRRAWAARVRDELSAAGHHLSVDEILAVDASRPWASRGGWWRRPGPPA